MCIFAHPDDETVACAGTLKLLNDLGHEVIVISATDGSAGEVVSKEAAKKVAELGSVGTLRRQELRQAISLLGIDTFEILEFADGHITNEVVWGKLLLSLIEVLEKYQPDVVITFDHTGWYYHLDHVGVSIAATLAVQKVERQPKLFFHSLMPSHKAKWSYAYEALPVTHCVDVTSVIPLKLQAMDAHRSQALSSVKTWVSRYEDHYEMYKLVFSTDEGRDWLATQNLFQARSSLSQVKIEERFTFSAE